MKWLAPILLGVAATHSACTPQAGSDCPAVVSVGQPCTKEGQACLYGAGPGGGRCADVPEYKCQGGRWQKVETTQPPFCTQEAGTTDAGGSDAGGSADAPSDG